MSPPGPDNPARFSEEPTSSVQKTLRRECCALFVFNDCLVEPLGNLEGKDGAGSFRIAGDRGFKTCRC